MRKLALLTAAIAAMCAMALVPFAGARDIPVTLNLIAHQTGKGHLNNSQNRFVITGTLLKAGDRSHQKGHFRAVFNRNNRGRAVAYLRNGKIKVDSVGPANGNRFAIIGGTRHWEGVTGVMRAHTLNKRDTLLNFHVK